MRLLGLPPTVQRLLADGQLSAGHARALLGTPDRTRQEQIAREAVADGWSVRMVEDAIRGEATAPPEPSTSSESTEGSIDGAGLVPGTKLRPPGLLELENLLAEYLETRVKVQMGSKKGRVLIDFADLEDLERVYRKMTS